MHILLVTPYYVPAYAFGGPVQVARVMAADLLADGHAVTVATTDALDQRRRIPKGWPAEPIGATVQRFPNVLHRPAARAMAWTPRGFREWMRAHAADFDVVLLHDIYSVLSVAAARASARAGVPYVVQPMGSLAPSRERGRPIIKRGFLRLWGRRTLAEAAALLYSSETERADFQAAGAPARTLIRVGLPLELPPPVREPKTANPTIVYVGRLDPIKGLDRLIEAVALVRAERADLRLEVVGPGDEYRRRLERQAASLGLVEAVRFHGFVSPEEKVRLLESAHVFSLLSRSEGLPVAALEAMACGTPVVLSSGCHLPEIDGRAGVVVSGEPESAAAAFATLLGDAARRQALGDGAREFAEDFRHERVMPQMIELLEQLVAVREHRRSTLVGRPAR